ncbi:hypothetical protein HYV81_03550 [Candidatus Woesearchaeota archaeon]|nr:hypothetical protein [Candidatus Woesearchaeota archaeon]
MAICAEVKIMPDWIAHILIGLILAELFRVKRKSLVVVGAILPDILVKLELLSVLIPVDKYAITWLFNPLHTPIGMILFTVLLLPLFAVPYLQTYYLLFIGWGSHLIADVVFNKHVLLSQNLLLFPFSWHGFEIGLVWPDEYYFVLLPLAIIYCIILIHKYYKSSLNKRRR